MLKFNLKVIKAQYEQRVGKNFSLRALSELIGLNKNTLHAIENNKTRRADLDTLEKLCDFFGCEPGDLIIRVPSDQDRD